MNSGESLCNCKECKLRPLFFANIKDNELRDVCNSKHEKSFAKGDIICEEGDEIREFMYLKSGLVKIYKSLDNKRDQIIKIAGPFDFVSMLSIFSNTHYNYSISALEDSTVCYINLEVINKTIKTNGKFALDLLENMSRNSDDLIDINLNISKRNLRGRIAYILIYFSEYIYESNIFELPVSRKEIGEFIEMTTENVIRTLSEFRKDNIIKINGKTIEITDPGRLKQICEFG
jgi:CRP/FNR family transcriptional regulator